MPYAVLSLVELGLLVYCVLDVIRTPEGDVRNLPKLLWLLLIVVLPLAGGIAWLFAGRPTAPASLPYKGNRGVPPQVRARPTAPARPGSPDDDEAFLRSLRERAEEQRRRAREDGGT